MNDLTGRKGRFSIMRISTSSVAQIVDYLIIGSGVAGLTFARNVAPHGSTLILTKKSRAESNSNYAQGGIAGVMDENDDVHLHMEDTLIAGAGICKEDAVKTLVTEGPDRIRELIDLGAQFNMIEDELGGHRLALGREGGHSRNRIVHAVDRTGYECERALLSAVKDMPNLEILENYFVIDLLVGNADGKRRCVGAIALNTQNGKLYAFLARMVMLSTGGCGRLYLHTTNPEIATGDGVAMAWNAGAVISNMEFIQFHPTCLYHTKGDSFLISEAVRGEGGILRTLDGATFMHKYHPLAELAPRDIVARAIHAERIKKGDPCVVLDITHLDDDFIRKRFPTIYQQCLEYGIDITKEPIPVVPAAHYMCGGVKADLNGCTTLNGLYASGEVSCTGVHGANRLASNSLLEAMVWGHRSAMHVISSPPPPLPKNIPTEDIPLSAKMAPLNEIRNMRNELRHHMNDLVGIVRTDKDLARAQELLCAMDATVSQWLNDYAPHPELYELRNMVTLSKLIVTSAIGRRESRGLHYNLDCLERDDINWHKDTQLINEDA